VGDVYRKTFPEAIFVLAKIAIGDIFSVKKKDKEATPWPR